MSPITSTDDALDFVPAMKRGKSRREAAIAAVTTFLLAMRKGLSAAQRYRELTARGVAPDAAARRVFADHFETR